MMKRRRALYERGVFVGRDYVFYFFVMIMKDYRRRIATVMIG